jgi:protein SCO1/2
MTKIKQAILIISVILIVYFAFNTLQKVQKKTLNDEIQIGTNFLLRNQDDQLFTEKNFNGKYTLVLFGFSRCPHVCPNQLAMLQKSLDAFSNLQAFFISVDPENDTVEKLKEFHKNFHQKIQMLTGDRDMTNKLIEGYKIYVQPDENPEKFNHSTIMYLMGANGKYITHFVPVDDEELHEDLGKYIQNK